MQTAIDRAWLLLRALLRHAYCRVFTHCARRGLNGLENDRLDSALQRWLIKHW